jgi:glycosyltransferase involved in cell wall biosynthesis
LNLGYYSVSFQSLDENFRSLVALERPKSALLDAATRPRRSSLYRSVQVASQHLPGGVRNGLVKIYFHQKAALLAVAELAGAVFAGLRDLAVSRRQAGAAFHAETKQDAQDSEAPALTPGSADEFERDVRPGDVVMLLGSAWFPGYAAMIDRVVQQKSVRIALLIYDIVPLRRPEWCDSTLIGVFSEYLHGLLPKADLLMTISRASADDIERYAREMQLDLRSRLTPIPMGTGFTVHRERDGGEAHRGSGGNSVSSDMGRLPPAGTYALIVSTIEARKNHGLLFRVWRRLLDDMPADEVPALVFAGRVGWLVADLMGQLRNAAFLNGKIVVIEDPTDGELEALYEGCMFTLFPSFYEGWGLPVTESLGYGRPCVISNATSLPEAGGSLARYFDPDNVGEAYEVIRAVIEDPAGLAAWRARVAADFVPVSWEVSARAIVAALSPDPPATTEIGREPAIGLAV